MSQEVFYPINSPLINYFFYKAPFVSNSYVLVTFDIDNGGTGYTVNDIVVSAGGTYTNPAIFQVTAIGGSGQILSAIITNGGRYTMTPLQLTQASTNGSGTGAVFDNLVFNADILPNGVNVPLAGGFIYFYDDEDHTVRLPTYSDISDINNPVVNTNPIQLGASGECSLFYLKNRKYYIVITDYTGDQANPVHTIEHYNPADQQISAAFNNNFIANPQFNYPIEFWKSTDEVGEINAPSTFVAWGCEFLEDADTETQNIITFNNVSGLEIEGHPINELVLDSDIVSSSETLKDLRWTIGAVDLNAEGNMTFSAQMMSKTSSNIPVVLLLERNFGEGGSVPEITPLITFTVTPTRTKFIFNFVLPSIIGKVIEEGNYLATRLQIGLKTVCTFGITNVMELPGNVANPVFVDESQGFGKSQILGVATDLNSAGLPFNYSPYFYTDGDIFPLPDTGSIILAVNDAVYQQKEKCDGSIRKVNDYSPHNIPYGRLYDVIGHTFGGSGSLIATSNDNVVTAGSAIGEREKSDWTANTAPVTVVKTMTGLQYLLDAVISGSNTIEITFVNLFAPTQTPATIPNVFLPPLFLPYTPAAGLLSYWTMGEGGQAIACTTIDGGSVSTQAKATLTFNDFGLRTAVRGPRLYSNQFLDYAISSTFNSRGGVDGGGIFRPTAAIYFSLDNVAPNIIGIIAGFDPAPIVVPFFSNFTPKQNMTNFVKKIANPFQYTITVNSFPVAGQSLLYSDKTTDFYGWFTVDGVGTDPMIPSRTGVEFPIFTGNTNTQIAEIIAEILNDYEFNLPAPVDLPDLVLDSKVSYFINL